MTAVGCSTSNMDVSVGTATSPEKLQQNVDTVDIENDTSSSDFNAIDEAESTDNSSENEAVEQLKYKKHMAKNVAPCLMPLQQLNRLNGHRTVPSYSRSCPRRANSNATTVSASSMQELIWLPDKKTVQAPLLICFRARYDHLISIKDCFEIEIEKPSDPVSQALTWSAYYNCNTLKYLVSCTPDGLVTFISEGFFFWGGSSI
ncbi:hypothetical protein AVEN_12899-1 [Araneus ventricosus]|uniref:DDE Tnp4 domain-containing protein n=1 Tax=Araneus ventricosus TaxID=182803 RepID=A0A4Y2HKF1_ARAVE|nr:hypothetical protein AVEN_12899-1 [Araneus ventricosus]